MTLPKFTSLIAVLLSGALVSAQNLPAGLDDSVVVNPIWVIETLQPMLDQVVKPAHDSAALYSCLSGAYMLSGDMYNSLKVIRSGLRRFSENNRVLHQSGNIYATIGRLDSAVIYQRAAAESYLAEGDTSRYHSVQYNLAISHFRNGDLEEAERINKINLEYFKRIGDAEKRTIVLAALANTYAEKGNDQLARDYMLNALENIDLLESHFAASLYQNLGVNFEESGEYEAAAGYYDKSIEMALRTSNDRIRISASTNKAVMKVSSGQYQEARSAFEKLSEDTMLTYFPDRRIEVYYSWFKADSAVGDYQSAYKHVKNFHNLMEIENEKQIKESIADTEAKYQVKEEKAEKLALAERLGAEETISRNQRIALLLAGFAGLLLVLGLWFVRRESRRRAALNEALRIKNQEVTAQSLQISRLNQDLNHRTSNYLDSIIILLERQRDSAAAAGMDVTVVNSLERQVLAFTKVQDKLGADLDTVNLREYLEDFCGTVREALAAQGRPVRFDTNIADVDVKPAFAAPLALIINELATNSMKYARREDGILRIALDAIEEKDGELRVFYRDGGSQEGEIDQEVFSSGQGVDLILGFTEELKGEVVRYGEESYDYEVVFGLVG
jgi:two-component sensor histidine kinase